MILLPLAAVLPTFAAVANGQQVTFQSSITEHGVASANSALTSLSSDTFTSFSHPSFPTHSVRIKKSPDDWCDPTVNKYTGWIDVTPARHLFFYFFESRNDPDSDPVVLWTNGGPGGSSSLALLTEHGPCNIVNDTVDGLEFNPYGWNEHSNIFFIDQPINVGFSYSEYGETVSTTEEAAKDIAAFVAIFFKTFSKFEGREFHLSGESYAGRYLPVYATEIYEQNSKLTKAGETPINLKSVLIGNGWTDINQFAPSYYDIVCTPASLPPVLDISTCVRMKSALPRVMKQLTESCYDTFDLINCGGAFLFLYTEIMMPSIYLNNYDISKLCDNTLGAPCYEEQIWIVKYLNRPEIQDILGIPENTTFVDSNFTLNQDFWANLDMFRVKTQYYLEGLLDRGIHVLLYAGDYDYVCNWVGVLGVAEELEWNGGDKFREDEMKVWTLPDNEMEAGKYKAFKNLAYATIHGAGHLAPHDKPKEALHMFKRWVHANGPVLTADFL